jgi:DHA1 family multidrug resistance protein-like MFS transporter
MEQERRTPPWSRQLAALWVGQCTTISGATFVFPFLPLMVRAVGVQDLGAIALWSGAVITASQLGQAVVAPLWGRLADRVGRKPMLIRAMLGASLTLMLTGFAPNIGILFLLRMATGLLAGTGGATNALVATSAPAHRVGHSLGVIQSANYVGGVVGPGIGGVVVAAFGIRAGFFVAAVLPLLAACLIAATVRENFVARPSSQPREGIRRAVGAAGVGRLLVTLVLLAFLAQGISTALSPITPLRLAMLIDAPHLAIGIGAATMLQALGATVAALNVSRLARAIGLRAVITAGGVAAAVAFGLIGVAPSLAVLLACTTAGGLAAGMLLPSINTLLGRTAPVEVRAEMFGYTTSAMSLGGAVLPLASSLLVSGFGARAPYFLVAALYLGFAWWARIRLPASGSAESRRSEELESPEVRAPLTVGDGAP